MNQDKTLPGLEKKFQTGNDKKHEVKAIINCVVYGKKTNNQIPC